MYIQKTISVAKPNRTAIQERSPQTEAVTLNEVIVVGRQNQTSSEFNGSQAAKNIANTSDLQCNSEKRMSNKSRKVGGLLSVVKRSMKNVAVEHKGNDVQTGLRKDMLHSPTIPGTHNNSASDLEYCSMVSTDPNANTTKKRKQ